MLWAFAASILVGSAIPFVPTGELVSGAAALAAGTPIDLVWIFAIAWVCSVCGDTLLLVEVRLFRHRLQAWLDQRTFAGRVARAQQQIASNGFNAVVTGRLIPGGRAPVIVALGLGSLPVRRFLVFDTVACAVWAALYSTIGAVGSSLTGSPVLAMTIAIAMAVALAAVVSKARQLHTSKLGLRRA